LVGLAIFLGGEHTPSTAFCQIPGWSVRITAQTFRAAVGVNSEFNAVLLRYTQALLTQVSQSIACNRAHSIEERCARWLLLTHDSVHGDSFMARRGAVGRDPFEAAVRAYMSCNSDMPHDDAARAVADIICHRW
jgi:CRP-like cAMP-binding protein